MPAQAFSRHLRRASGPNLIMSSGTVTVRAGVNAVEIATPCLEIYDDGGEIMNAGCRDDARALLVMIQELAEFEKELDQVYV